MEKFTNEEFNVFCKRLKRELEIIARASNGEFIEIDNLNNEKLKEIVNIIQKDGGNITEEQEEEFMANFRKDFKITKMTDEQFAKLLENPDLFEHFEMLYNPNELKEEYDKLPDNKKLVYENFKILEEIKYSMDRKEFENIFNRWIRLPIDFQSKHFNEIINYSDDIKVRSAIWESSKEELQNGNSNIFTELLAKYQSNDDNVVEFWGHTSPKLQMEYFDDFIKDVNENFKTKKEIWRVTDASVQHEKISEVINEDFKIQKDMWQVTDASVQQKMLKQILNKSENNVKQQVNILKVTSKEAKIENKDFILQLSENIKNSCFEENKKIIEQNRHLNGADKENNIKKYQGNKKVLYECWKVLGTELQNTEKGKEYFFDVWTSFEGDYPGGYNRDMLEVTSNKFVENNFIEIIENAYDKKLNNFLMQNISLKVSDKTFMEKENFSFLYKINNSGQEINDEVYDKIRGLFKYNNKIVHNVDYKFLSTEDFLNIYTDEQLLRITNYQYLQQFIYTECYEKGNLALKESIKYLLGNDNNWIISLDRISQNITEQKRLSAGFPRLNQYSNLIDNISEIDSNEITEEFKQQLLCVLSQERNYFDINTYNDVSNYTTIRQEVCERIFNGDLENIPATLKEEFKNQNDELYKFALLEHQFGISLNYAKRLVYTYGEDIREFPEGEVKEYLSLLNEIINCPNIEEVIKKVNIELENGNIEPWLQCVDARNAEGKILNMFEDLYNESVYDSKKEKPTEIEVYTDKHGQEHNISICELNDDFCMRIRVEGAYRGIEEGSNENFKEYYERPNMENHGNCESFIRQDSIACARHDKNSILVGFSQMRKNQLTMMAPYDLGSSNEAFSNYNYSELIGSSPSKYRTPGQMIDHTRHTHNEIVTDRYFSNEDGKLEKLKPDFVIWVEDEISQNPREINDETKRIAAELGIPIVVINREKFAQKESERIAVMEKLIKGEKITDPKQQRYADEYKNMKTPELIKQVIIKYGNNRTGIQFSDTLREKYFTLEQFKNTKSIIDKSIDNMEIDEKKECLKVLEQTYFKEHSELYGKTTQYGPEWLDYIEGSLNESRQQLDKIQDQENIKNQNISTLLQQYLDQGIDINTVNSIVKETQEGIRNQQQENIHNIEKDTDKENEI